MIYHGRKLKITLNKHKKGKGAEVPGPHITQKTRSLGWCMGQGFQILPRGKVWYVDFLDTNSWKITRCTTRCFAASPFLCSLDSMCMCFFNKNGLETIWQKIPSVTSHLSKSSALVKVTFNLGPFYCIFLIDFIILSWVASLPSGSLQVHSFSFTSSTMGAMATACASYMSNTGWVAQILIEA